jgi:carbonic anhydrase/acetyltransferase-like protein (isoleucine patch superfamily)
MPVYALGDAEPSIDATAYVHPDAVIIGNVTIGAESSIWPCAVLRGDDGRIRIGARTSIQDGSILHCTAELDTVVGDEAVIGHMVHLEGCIVEDRALVGNGAVVLHRAVISTGSLVGSNAVVPAGTVVPPGAMALGVPAKMRENAVNPDAIVMPMQSYVARASLYRDALRRLD